MLPFCFNPLVRQGRLKAPPGLDVAYYHCFSRIVDRRHVIGPGEAEAFSRFMRQAEAFSGVRVLTHCILNNHFHLVLQVPRRPDVLPDDEELLRRIEHLHHPLASGAARQSLALLRAGQHHAAAERFREQFFRRMWDLSSFMKDLKQRFSQWFNRTHGRRGTLWEERFQSVLIEGAGLALASVAAYVDLNSVRANLTHDPALHRWCGYARAMAGDPSALEGLRLLMAAAQRVPVESLTCQQALEAYRQWLYQKGEQNEGTDAQGRPLRLGFSREAVLAVLQAKGKVSPADYVRVRVRYFTGGAVIGTRAFVNHIHQTFRHRFGARRKDGARRMRGVDSDQLHALRDLRLNVFG